MIFKDLHFGATGNEVDQYRLAKSLPYIFSPKPPFSSAQRRLFRSLKIRPGAGIALGTQPLNPAPTHQDLTLIFPITTPRNPPFGATSLVIMCPTTGCPIFPSDPAAALAQHALARTYTPALAVSRPRIDLVYDLSIWRLS
jgi:hypothetical protein